MTRRIFSNQIEIEKLLDVINEKNLILMFTNVIKIDKIDENNKVNLFINKFETHEDKTDKNN